jgi:hypothetical protein
MPRLWLKIVLGVLVLLGITAALALLLPGRGMDKFRAEILVKGTVRQQEELLQALSNAEELLQSTAGLFADKGQHQELLTKLAEVRDSLPAVTNQVEEVQRLLKAGRYDQVRNRLSSTYGLSKGEMRDTLRKLISQKSTELETATAPARTLANLRNTVWRNSQMIRLRLSRPEALQGPMAASGTNSGLPRFLFEAIRNLDSPQLEQVRSNDPPELQNLLGASLHLHEQVLRHIEEHLGPGETNRQARALFDTAREAYAGVKAAAAALSADYSPAMHDGRFTVDGYQRLVSEQSNVVARFRTGDQALANLLRHYDQFEDQYYTVVVEQRREPCDGDFNCSCLVQTVTPSGVTNREVPLGIHLARWNFYSPGLQTNYVREYKARHELKLRQGPMEEVKPHFLVEKPEELPVLARVPRAVRRED